MTLDGHIYVSVLFRLCASANQFHLERYRPCELSFMNYISIVSCIGHLIWTIERALPRIVLSLVLPFSGAGTINSSDVHCLGLPRNDGFIGISTFGKSQLTISTWHLFRSYPLVMDLAIGQDFYKLDLKG